MLLAHQKNASPYRGLPVDDKGASSAVTITSGETVALYYYNSGVQTADAGQAAGTVVVGKFALDNIRNELGSMQGNYLDSSVSFTSTAFTTEVAFPAEEEEPADASVPEARLAIATEGLANGEYCVDYSQGIIYGKKASTQTSLTATAYKVGINVAGGGGGIASDVTIKQGGNAATVNTDGQLSVTDGGISVPPYTHSSAREDWTATYTSTTSLTLSAGQTIEDKNLVFIKVKSSAGDTRFFVDGVDGVELTVTSNVITIAGAGTPFASGDVYDVGVNLQDKAFDADKNVILQQQMNPEHAHFNSMTTVAGTNEATGTHFKRIPAISFRGMGAQVYATTSGTNTLVKIYETLDPTAVEPAAGGTAGATWKDITDKVSTSAATTVTLTTGQTETFHVDTDRMPEAYLVEYTLNNTTNTTTLWFNNF